MIAALRNIGSWAGCYPRSEESESIFNPKAQDPERIERAACILVAGANITVSHPVFGLKIKKAVENGARLIVISPNENDLCRIAEKWLQPYPGTDLALLMGMSNVIVEAALYDNDFVGMYCNNFDEFKESLDDFPLGRVERITGVSRDLIEESARIYAGNKPAAIFWGTGITQSARGTDNVYALANLAILTSNIKYSRALNPLLGQNNALGTCDMGCLPDYYPGYQPVDSSDARIKFQSMWGKDLNSDPGLTLTEILDAVLEGKIKALYIIGSDIASSIAPSGKVHAALKKAKFVV
jgi:predicted molibdopterin-dependent oxidoreductase YjgC